jgi:putative ABC transport system permease protein
MSAWETVRTAWSAIIDHRMRSSLTVLGVLIGIAAVVLTVGLGEGAQASVGSSISALGSNLLIVAPGSATSTGGIRGGFGSASTLTIADADALSSPTVAPDVAAVAPVVTSSLELTAGTTNWTTSVVGTLPDWLSVRNRTLAAGTFITAAENSAQADDVILGSQTATELFGSTADSFRGAAADVGQSVTISGVQFTVIGVLTAAGTNSTADLDDTAIVPLATASNQLVGGTTRTSVSDIYVQATSQAALSAAYQETDTELLATHAITVAADADFTVTAQQSLLATATSVDKTLTVLLAGIAALSLLVGGIGVMNIMLVSVTERTREIGLRKALGARPAVIRRQFLVEASILGMSGGILGAALGIGGAVIIPHLIPDAVRIDPRAVAGSIVIAVAIGLVFGVYPAGRAAQLAPIDALRSS